MAKTEKPKNDTSDETKTDTKAADLTKKPAANPWEKTEVDSDTAPKSDASEPEAVDAKADAPSVIVPDEASKIGPPTENLSETSQDMETQDAVSSRDEITPDTDAEQHSTFASKDETGPDDTTRSEDLPEREDHDTLTQDRPGDEADKTPPAPLPIPVQAPEPRRSSFWPAVFGGLIAATLGFIAGRGDMLDPYFPRANAPEPVDLTPLTEETADLSARVAQIEAQDAPAPADLSAEFEEMAQSIDVVRASLADLVGRLESLEARPAASAPVPAPAPQEDNSEEIAALQTSIDQLEARLVEEDARASAEAERILARAALTRVMTAVDSGEPFEGALGDLQEITPVEVPEVLQTAAADGVPTLATLRETFPDAARAALGAARSEVPESDVSGLGGFLRRQLSARSVMPREGSDPDAVLSRAEAAVRTGDLDTALNELDALPAGAQSAMQDWRDGAQARKEASDAAKGLSDSLTVN